jgi:hypothetical protein
MTYAMTKGKEAAKGDDREQCNLKHRVPSLSKRGDTTQKSESERQWQSKEIRVNISLFCQHGRTCDTLAIFFAWGSLTHKCVYHPNSSTDGE